MVNSGKSSSASSSEDRIINRVNSLVKIFQQFCADWGHIGKLDNGLLLETVRQYFKASDELKRRHGIEHTDGHKRAAYMIWAISKYKPVQYVGRPDKPRILVNELFALCSGISHLKVDIADFNRIELETLLYLIHSRDIEPEWLSVTMYLFEQRSSIRIQKDEEIGALRMEIDKLRKNHPKKAE